MPPMSIGSKSVSEHPRSSIHSLTDSTKSHKEFRNDSKHIHMERINPGSSYIEMSPRLKPL